MTPAFALLIRSSLVLACGLLAASVLARRSAALRHGVLAATMLAASVVGPLTYAGPRWDLPAVMGAGPLARTQVAARSGDVVVASGRVQRTGGPLPAWLVAATWSAGTSALLAILAVAIVRLRRATADATPARDGRLTALARAASAAIGLRRSVSIRMSSDQALAATWGWLRPEVIVPAAAADWTDERMRVVLCHELEHVRRRDWVVQMAAEIACAVYWFNPLVWIARSQLRRESELACDDAVLRTGVAPVAYAAHLTDLARFARAAALDPLPAVSMARPSSLPGRIAIMLNPDVDRRPLTGHAAAWTVALLLALSASIAAVRLPQESPAPLTGAVYDMSGAVMPDVRLTLEGEGHQTLETRTDQAGRFSFPAVAPGAYVLQASLAGFRTLRYELTLREMRDWTQVLTLQVGEVVETVSVEASREAPSAPGPEAAAPRLKVGGAIRPPKKIKDVHARYPEAMKKAGQQGAVSLAAVIGRDGSVIAVHVLSANIHPDLAAAAVEAVRQWRFEPTLLNGAPVEVAMTVTVNFTLAD